MSRVFHSIRWRVQAWHGLLLLGVILAFCLIAYQLARDNQLRRIDQNLRRTEHTLIRALVESRPAAQSGTEGKPTAISPGQLLEQLRNGSPVIPAEISALFRGSDPGHSYFAFWDDTGHKLLQSPNCPEDLVPPVPTAATDPWDVFRISHNRCERIHFTPDGPLSIVGLDITPEREEMRRFLWSLGAAGFGVWWLGLFGGWWLSGRAIRPIRNISHAAMRIADGNLNERIGTDGGDSELDQLSRILNRTFDSLRKTLERQRQFTADASHELRTPIAVLLSESQHALKRDRSSPEYRSALQTCHATADRMRRLIEALLLLARQEAVDGARPQASCDLGAIALEAATQLQPLADARKLTINLSCAPAPCLGDPAALTILVSNLVANAIQHHDQTSGCIVVTSSRQNGRALLTVRDDGPGIAPADLPHIFDRFYRADKVRDRRSGHAGLGLAIAKSIAGNHGGTIVAKNNPDRGACFTVSLPEPPPSNQDRQTPL